MHLVQTLPALPSASPSMKPPLHCRFCAEVVSTPTSSETPWNTPLYETANFLVLPSLGAIVEGWLLVLPKNHSLCLGSLDSALLEELKDLTDKLRPALSAAFSYKPTVFEHGPSHPKSVLGCGIDHAHLHLVPLEFKLSSSHRVQNLEWEGITDDLASLSASYQKGAEYLLLWEPDSQPVLSINPAAPSQFFRRAIAEVLLAPHQFDYRTHPFTERVLSTIARLRPHLSY
jgi:ATP adenylyltransferase